MLQRHFGLNMFNELKAYETLCSGIIAGEKNMLIKLFKAIAEIAYFSQDPGAFVDQCFYNIAIRKIYSEVTMIAGGDSDWCANLGTLIAIPMNTPLWSTGKRSQYDSYERFRNHKNFIDEMLCPIPTMNSDYEVCNSKGEPYCIVHQYDRYQFWKDVLLNKFV